MFTAGAGGFIRRLGGIRGLRGELWSGGLLSDDGQPGGDEQNQKNCDQSEFHFFFTFTTRNVLCGKPSSRGHIMEALPLRSFVANGAAQDDKLTKL